MFCGAGSVPDGPWRTWVYKLERDAQNEFFTNSVSLPFHSHPLTSSPFSRPSQHASTIVLMGKTLKRRFLIFRLKYSSGRLLLLFYLPQLLFPVSRDVVANHVFPIFVAPRGNRPFCRLRSLLKPSRLFFPQQTYLYLIHSLTPFLFHYNCVYSKFER